MAFDLARKTVEVKLWQWMIAAVDARDMDLVGELLDVIEEVKAFDE